MIKKKKLVRIKPAAHAAADAPLVAIYARVSTKDGRQQTQNQLIELRAYCARMKWKIYGEYVDNVSGAGILDKMPAQKEMFDDASKRKFDRVLVWSLDRLTRSGPQATLSRLKTLLDHGVDFWSYSESFFRSVTPATNEMLIGIAAYIANEETKRLSERIRAGLGKVREDGRHIGRRKIAVTAADIQQLRADGLSETAICERLNVSRATLFNRMKKAS